MAKLSQVQQDVDAVENGRWFPWIYDVEILIRAAASDRFQDRLEELKRDHPHARAIEAAPESDQAKDAVHECTLQAAAEELIGGWRNLLEDDGSPIECTVERRVAMAKDKRWQHLFKFVLNRATADRNFLAVTEKHDAKN